jgi:hypothetical protein
MSEEAPIATEVTSVETTIPNSAPTDTGTSPDFQSIVPAEFVDKPWVKDVKDIDGFFKMANDMKSELGRRAETTVQGPESVDAYELGDPVNADFQNKVKEMFLKNGVSVELAKGLDADWNDIVSEFAPDQAQMDEDFHKRTGEVFGDRADEAVAVAKSLLTAHTPETMQDDVNGLGNKELTIMAAVLDSIQAKYINEDDLPRERGGATGVATSEERRAEAKSLMASDEWKNKSHPGHDAVALKVAKLYEGIT